jgi:hypothetical protein
VLGWQRDVSGPITDGPCAFRPSQTKG